MSRQTTTRRRHGVRRMSERKRLTITAISAVLALVTVVICALTGVFNFHKGNERILPNLVGQTEESAKAQLAELDAEPSITYENSDETKGIVIRQDVNEGTQLKHRQTVAFVVSLGPKEQPTAPEDTPVAIPSFVGLTLEQGQATAKRRGDTGAAGGAVVLTRVEHPSFPNTISGVVYQPGAFSAIDDGQINEPIAESSYRAAKDAMNGWDASGGAIYYYNPDKTSNKWIRTRPVIKRIGNHLSCK